MEKKTNWLEYTSFAAHAAYEFSNVNCLARSAMHDIRLKNIDTDRRPLLYAACGNVYYSEEYFIQQWLDEQDLNAEEYAKELDRYRAVMTPDEDGYLWRPDLGAELIFDLANDNSYLNGRITAYDFEPYTVDERRERYVANGGNTDIFEIGDIEYARWAEELESENVSLKCEAERALGHIDYGKIPENKRTAFYAACKKCGIPRIYFYEWLETFYLTPDELNQELNRYTDIVNYEDYGAFGSITGELLFKLAADNDYLMNDDNQSENYILDDAWNHSLARAKDWEATDTDLHPESAHALRPRWEVKKP